jgi:putative transposase
LEFICFHAGIYTNFLNFTQFLTTTEISQIIISKNDNWKQNIEIGKRNNQNFVSIPHDKFIQMIQYKAEEVGIEVILTEESYTSKIDHLANEPLIKQVKYLGKRVKRGFFKSSVNKFLNADINGAIGIMRKVVPSVVFSNSKG